MSSCFHTKSQQILFFEETKYVITVNERNKYLVYTSQEGFQNSLVDMSIGVFYQELYIEHLHHRLQLPSKGSCMHHLCHNVGWLHNLHLFYKLILSMIGLVRLGILQGIDTLGDVQTLYIVHSHHKGFLLHMDLDIVRYNMPVHLDSHLSFDIH